MKAKQPRSVDALRSDLLADERGLTEYVEQRVVSQLGAIIERVLEQRNLSQSELARVAGMHQPDLNSIVRGRSAHIPTVATMRRLAKALDVSLRVDIAPSGAVTISAEADEGMTASGES